MWVDPTRLPPPTAKQIGSEDDIHKMIRNEKQNGNQQSVVTMGYRDAKGWLVQFRFVTLKLVYPKSRAQKVRGLAEEPVLCFLAKDE